MLSKLDKLSPIIAISINLIAILFLYLKANEGEFFTYALDDPYIHLDIAQNLAYEGNYGVNKDEFSSPSSSPLWSLLIAGLIKLLGNSDKIPFYLNLILIIPTIFMLNSILKDVDFRGTKFFFLSAISLMLPIPTLVLTGMEHMLHITLILLLFLTYSRDLKREKISILAIIIIIIIPLIRYESIFFTSILSLAYLRKVRIKLFLLYFLLPFLPIIIFGLYSISNGYHFFPNSLLLKGSTSFGSFTEVLRFFYQIIPKIVENYAVNNLFILLSLILFISFLNRIYNWNLFNSFILLLGHGLFAQFGWLYRYEAYILAITLPIILVSVVKLRKQLNFNPAYFIAFIIISLPLFHRMVESYSQTDLAMNTIKSQHLNIARFIKNNYSKNKKIAMHDIGAVGYYTNCKIIDLYGLANIEVADAKRDNNFNPNFYNKFIKNENADLIVVYRKWFWADMAMPKGYLLAYQWECEVGGDIGEFLIDFYVPNGKKIDFQKKMNSFDMQSNLIFKRKTN